MKTHLANQKVMQNTESSTAAGFAPDHQFHSQQTQRDRYHNCTELRFNRTCFNKQARATATHFGSNC